jgi:molecular chaperone DnaK
MSSDKVLGIDLGTTNSAFAILEEGDPEIIVNAEGDRTTPSVVTYEEDGSRTVGAAAKNQAVQKSERTITSIKRHIGEEDYTVEVDGTEYTPQEVSAAILQKIKEDAEEYLGEEIDRAVITVPAYFNDKERQATKQAGEIAGFTVERIVNEPTAAAMAYGTDADTEDEQAVLVYDLGGGTFDVSILEIGHGVYEVVSTNGDNDLGGDDWDEAIIEYVADEFEEEHGIDLRDDDQALQRLKEAAERAKMDLSSRKQTTINLPFIAAGDEGPITLEQELTRTKFENLTEDLVDRTIDPTEQALEDSGYEASEVDDIILIGGSTRMPMIKQKVESHFGLEPKNSINPDEAVALGAAIQSGVVDDGRYGEQVDDIILLDVTSLSLGVEVKGGLFETIIPKDTTIPTSASKMFTTSEDDQTTVSIRVFQGEREIAAENEFLGEFELTGIEPAEAGQPKIEVTFQLDENGILNVTAEDKASNQKEEIEVESESGLDEEEIE